MVKRLIALAGLIFVLGVASVHAQGNGGPVIIRASNGSTVFDVGDAANNAVKVTCVVGCSASAGTADGAAFTAGSSTGSTIFGIVDETGSTTVAEDKTGATRMSVQRSLYVQLRNGTADIGVAAAPLQVSLANTGANGTAILVTGTGGTFPVSGTLTAVTSITNAVITRPLDGCGATNYETAAVMPNTLTVVTATATCVDWLYVTNSGSATATATVTDGQGTPITYLNAVQVPPNSTVEFHPAGKLFTSGIKIQASAATTLTYAVKGRQ
jgi:hypothetical protein